MKNLKKILALVLAFACAFTMFAVAGAADFTDKDKIKNYEAVNTLVALNILKGRDDGSFDPDATVTRAEMAKMIFVIWNGGKDDATAYETMDTIFSDVSSHWAKGYINFCAANNIIAGMGDGTFAPDQTVTGQQAAKMLLVLMGYDDQHAGLTGHKWAQNTMSYAGLAGLFKDVEAPVEQGMPRQYAAQMVYNTLEANRVKWSADNNAFDEITQWSGQNFVKETVGRRYMNYATVTGILVEARNGDEKGFTLLLPDSSSKYSIAHTTNTEKQDFNNKLWADTKYTTDLSEYLGQEVKVSYNTEEHDKNRDNAIYGVYSTENNVVVTTTANKIADAKESGKIKLDDVKYKINDHMLYYYSTTVNGAATDLTGSNFIDNDSTDLENVFGTLLFNDKGEKVTSGQTKALYADYEPLSANTVKFVDFDNDGKFDLAIDYPMAVGEVSMVSSSTISVKDVRGVTLTTNAPKREDVIEYEGIAKGDIVQITWDAFKDKATFKKLDTVDETVGSVRNTVNNENEEFNLSTGWVKRYSNEKDNKTGLMGSNSITTKLKSGDKATFALVNGIAYYVDRTQSGTGNDVAVVVSTGETYGQGADNGSVEAKLMFADGTTSVVTVDSIIDNLSNNSFDLDESSTLANNFWNAFRIPNTSADNTLNRLNCYLASYVDTKGDDNSNNDEVKTKYTAGTNYLNMLSNGTIAPALVTYSRSGNDYTLQLLDAEANDAGYDEVNFFADWKKDKGSTGDAKVGGYNLLDDGTVFVVYGKSVKRYTGSQAKKLFISESPNDGGLYDAGSKTGKAYSLIEKSNGVSRVRVAAVYANAQPSVRGVGNYAYILDDTSSKTIDGTSYIILTAYTKDGAETLYAEKNASDRNNYDKGTVVDFSYTNSTVTDGGAEYKVIDDVEDTHAVLGAITGWDRNDVSVLVEGYDESTGKFTATSNSPSKDVDTDDTTVLVVDTDGKVGVSVGKEGIQVADEPSKGLYQVNAKVVYSDNDDAYDVIVIDSLNNWMDEEWQISSSSNGVNYKGTNNNVHNSKPTPTPTPSNTVDISNTTFNGAAHTGDWTLSNVYAELIKTENANKTFQVPAGQTLLVNINPSMTASAGADTDDLHIHYDSTNTSRPYTLYLGNISFDNSTTIDLSKIRGVDNSSILRLSFPANGFNGTLSFTPSGGSEVTYDTNSIRIGLTNNALHPLGNLNNNGLATFRWNATTNEWDLQR